MNKNSKGITLVALVVTIIVLLILAGVSLSLVSGENGILDKATNASDITTESARQEKLEIIAAEIKTKILEDKYVNNISISSYSDYINDYLDSKIGSERKTDDVRIYFIDKDLVCTSDDGSVIYATLSLEEDLETFLDVPVIPNAKVGDILPLSDQQNPSGKEWLILAIDDNNVSLCSNGSLTNYAVTFEDSSVDYYCTTAINNVINQYGIIGLSGIQYNGVLYSSSTISNCPVKADTWLTNTTYNQSSNYTKKNATGAWFYYARKYFNGTTSKYSYTREWNGDKSSGSAIGAYTVPLTSSNHGLIVNMSVPKEELDVQFIVE